MTKIVGAVLFIYALLMYCIFINRTKKKKEEKGEKVQAVTGEKHIFDKTGRQDGDNEDTECMITYQVNGKKYIRMLPCKASEYEEPTEIEIEVEVDDPKHFHLQKEADPPFYFNMKRIFKLLLVLAFLLFVIIWIIPTR